MFIVVECIYDHYKFQTNVFASTSKQRCLKWIYKFGKEPYKQEVWEYDTNDRKYKMEHSDFNQHYWIQELKESD